MKFIGLLALLLTSANFAEAQSISDKELQERFNQAFSVFNQQSGANTKALSTMTNDKKTQHKQDELKAISMQDEGDKNIVKQTNSTTITSQTLPAKPKKLTMPALNKHSQHSAGNFILLEEREVLIDMQNATLKQIVQEALNQISNNEQWTIRWRLTKANQYLLTERINLTAEIGFDQFIGQMLETITNITGIRLSTKVFNKNRIIIITDSY